MTDDTAAPATPSVGTRLRDARMERGFTVEEVARTTRLRSALVRDLEADRFDSSGGAVYARGHIRNLAAALGVDARPLVADFDRTHDSASSLASVALPGDPVAARASARSGPPWGAAMVLVVAGLLVLLVVGIVSNRTGGADQLSAGGLATAAPTTPSPTAAPTPSPSTAPATTPAAVSPSAAPAPTGVNVQLTVARAASWVRVTDPGNTTLFEGVLAPGEVKTFTNPDQLRLVLGNAGAVSLTLNGQDLGVSGAMGQVKRLLLTAGSTSPAAG